MGDELARQLRRVRDGSGRSLRELERQVHVSSSSLSRYFAGQAVPPWPVVVALCRVAGADPRPLRPIWEDVRRGPRLPGPAVTARNDLPLDPGGFTGRAAELAAVRDAVRTARVVTIDGMAGVGKTALAVHAAHLLTPDLPDAQLYVDLRGFTPGGEPLPAGEALRLLLGALGVSSTRTPEDAEERAALWRAELAQRRALVVLDNAVDAAQVRPLLPGAGASVVLVTSRRRLVDLDGAHPLTLDVPPPGDAAALFAAAVGDPRADASPAVAEVLRRCGHLPLALRIAAARLRHRPAWTADTLVDRLRDGELGPAAVFEMSVRQLDPAQRRMFRLLGRVPGPDIDAYGAAAVAGIPLGNARSLLDDLVDAHLLQEPTAGRFRQHDLVRGHARELAAAEEPDDELRAAADRLADHYLHTAATAVDRLYPETAHLRPRVARPATAAPRLDDAARATAWLDAELANLVAVGTADDTVRVGALAATLYPYLDNHAHHGDALTLCAAALAASRRSGDRAGEARALLELGVMNWRQGRYERAHDDCHAALALAREVGDRYGEARALNGLGNVALRQRDYDRAYASYVESQRLSAEVGDRFGEAIVLSNLGLVRGLQDRPDEAREHLRHSLAAYREVGSPGGEGTVLGNLALVDRRQGRFDDARERLHGARDVYRRLGYPSGEAEALNGLGEVARCVDDPAQALRDHEAALALAGAAGNHFQLARAHEGAARAHRSLGDSAAARGHAGQALDLYTALGVPEAGEMRALIADPGDADRGRDEPQ